MSTPIPAYRDVAGLRIPAAVVVRVIPAIRARYPEATDSITDDEAAVRAALRAWMIETLADHEAHLAKDPLGVAVAQTIADYEAREKAAREQAVAAGALITEVPSAP